MTRTYAALRLLEHGPLRYGEFKEITGWSHRRCQNTLKKLLGTHRVRKGRSRSSCYELRPLLHLEGAMLTQSVMNGFAGGSAK
jgi:hypothetical protein